MGPKRGMRPKATTVDEFITFAPGEIQPKLREIRAAIKEAAPMATEVISYGMAGYRHKGPLVWFGYSKAHIGLYVRPPVIGDHKKDLEGYATTKSAVHLSLDREIPNSLVKKLFRAAITENEARGSED